MRTWNLGLGDPLCLTLAADSRLATLDYANDHIWELQLGRGNPAALLLNTTYGLRARHMRMFPQFTEKHRTLHDPTQFAETPVLRKFAPNFLELTFSPFAGIEARLQYWVPDCHTISGRIRLNNQGASERKLQMEWVALLSPLGEGSTMEPNRMEAVWTLRGQTGDLFPVVFITGGASPLISPYPGLHFELSLPPEGSRQFTWAQVALGNWQSSFRQARATATRQWEAEQTRIEMTNSGQVEVFTGDEDWDATFTLGQTSAYSLLYSGTNHLRHTSFVSRRSPDQGYSPRGDGSDYPHLWSGQNVYEAWYLAQLLLPGGESFVRGFIRNFIQSANGDGSPDWRPGLAGQRAHMLAAPLLVSLTWELYQHEQDRETLESLYPHLAAYLWQWMSPRQDHDQDGFPEWDNPLQSGFEDNPAFAYWQAGAQGSYISLDETPDLAAYLYRENRLLMRMAEILGRRQDMEEIQARMESLGASLQACWDTGAAVYLSRDRDSHITQHGGQLAERRGSGTLQVGQSFDQPTRLMLHFKTGQEVTLRVKITVAGTTPDGKQVEKQVGREHVQWLPGRGTATLPDLYIALERVETEGLPEDGVVTVSIVDHTLQDHTQLVPLWAQAPDEVQLEKLLGKLHDPAWYGRPYGIPACPQPPEGIELESLTSVWLPWNTMVGEGLLAYGRREGAAQLVTRIMQGITANLKREHSFRKYYRVDEPQGVGEANALLGLPPLGLFLKTLGVCIVSPWEVHLEGFNPYSWPVRLQYRGLNLECRSDVTSVTFPDGQSVTVDDPAPCVVMGRGAS